MNASTEKCDFDTLLQRTKLIVIGGSAGSFPVIAQLLPLLTPPLQIPIVVCLHRLRNKREGFQEALALRMRVPVEEPCDKDLIEPGKVYLAPANYHLLIENKERFALGTFDLVQFSRPSIDVLFESAADVYQDRLLAILLSGANRDGTQGMKAVKRKKGITIAQDPATCSVRTMTESAIQAGAVDKICTPEQLQSLFKKLNKVLL